MSEDLTMQGVGTVIDEVAGLQAVGAQDGDTRKVGIGRIWLDLEREGGGESPVAICYVAEEETIRLQRVGGEPEATLGEVLEMVRSFKNGRAGVSAFGRAVANKEAGDVVLDEMQLEVC